MLGKFSSVKAPGASRTLLARRLLVCGSWLVKQANQDLALGVPGDSGSAADRVSRELNEGPVLVTVEIIDTRVYFNKTSTEIPQIRFAHSPFNAGIITAVQSDRDIFSAFIEL